MFEHFPFMCVSKPESCGGGTVNEGRANIKKHLTTTSVKSHSSYNGHYCPPFTLTRCASSFSKKKIYKTGTLCTVLCPKSKKRSYLCQHYKGYPINFQKILRRSVYIYGTNQTKVTFRFSWIAILTVLLEHLPLSARPCYWSDG